MDDYKKHLYALIFCGGGGTRLWPFSKDDRPKQFLKIGGRKSLLRQTFERILPLIPSERIYLVTVAGYGDEIDEEVPEIPKSQVLIEPARRNTAMAAGLGAVAICKKDPLAIIANIWSDPYIGNDAVYRKALLAGAKAASDGQNLVTTGVVPKYPHTGLGYVKKERVYDVIEDVEVYKVEKFTEKPKLEEAKRMLISGNYLWHVGLLIWRVDAFMKGLKEHSPATYERLDRISQWLGKPGGKDKVIKEYLAASDMSIDVALAEKAKNFLVVEGKYDWRDLGDFSVLWDIGEKDKDGNHIHLDSQSEWTGIDTKESIIISEGPRMVATIGLTDMIVVATENAILVAPKSQAQKVKKVVEKLKAENKKDFL